MQQTDSNKRPSKAVEALNGDKNKGGDNFHNIDSNDEPFQGHVAIHRAATTVSANIQSPSTHLTTTPSSWAVNRSPTTGYRRRQHLVVDQDNENQNSTSSNPLPSKNLNMSNLSSSQSLPRTGGSGRQALANERQGRTGRYTTTTSKHRLTQFDEAASSSIVPPDMEEMTGKNSSFKGWLAEGILDVLNTAAGFTISTTGTILSPPIAMTKNVILPGILAILVDTLDNITPPRIQDWFRILSSSVYHLYSVLTSTEEGQKLRQQVVLFFQTLLEVWSSPESRQVIVDGMATGVKLADALHTPEMQTFLQQVTILGCRLVDALASGKTKQLFHNGKNMVWQGIELAVDPSTTMALAEVTAHLCHALEELDDSFHPTPRAVRNTQNDTTYLRPLRLTDHQSDCIENVILSSLGYGQGESLHLFDEDDDDDILANDGLSVNSVPSNVVFPQNTTTSLLGDTFPRETNINHEQSMLGPCKGKVDVQLLKERILNQERSPPRTSMIAMDDHKNEEKSFPTFRLSSSVTTPITNNKDLSETINNNSVKTHYDMEESAPIDVDSDSDKYHTDSHWNVNKPYDTLEVMKNHVGRETLAIQFYQTVDNLLQQQRAEKQATIANIASNASGISVERVLLQRRAKVRSFCGGRSTTETKLRSKDIQERYSHLRSMGKYPPVMFYSWAVILGFVFLLWGGFGIYGFCTFFHVLGSPPSIPTNVVDTNGPMSLSEDLKAVNPRPNEIVLRIVKEVIHVSQDGSSDTHFHQKSDMDIKEESEFSEKEMKDMLQCLSRQ